MKYKNIEIGKNYVFDPDNTMEQTELGVSIVQVVDKKGLFTKAIVSKEVDPYTLQVRNYEIMSTPEAIAQEYTPNTVIITRFPADIPVFGKADVALFGKMAQHIITEKSPQFTEPELIGMMSLLNKIEFYSRNEG